MIASRRSARLFGLWAFLLCAFAGALARAKPAGVGERAAEFRLRDLKQGLWSLSEQSRRGSVVLDFFRTDCAPCKAGIPKLVALHRRLQGKAAQVVLVALLEDKEGRQRLDQFLNSQRLPFTVLVDAYGVVAKKYIAAGSQISLPSLFIIDKRRTIRHVMRTAPKSADEVFDLLRPHL
jgi:peroxiredoxin